MLSIVELAADAWIPAVFVLALVVRLIVRDRIALRMFTKAMEDTTPAERPDIIHALRGLIGRGTPPRQPDDEARS